jgi:hypothetical protein
MRLFCERKRKHTSHRLLSGGHGRVKRRVDVDGGLRGLSGGLRLGRVSRSPLGIILPAYSLWHCSFFPRHSTYIRFLINCSGCDMARLHMWSAGGALARMHYSRSRRWANMKSLGSDYMRGFKSQCNHGASFGLQFSVLHGHRTRIIDIGKP